MTSGYSDGIIGTVKAPIQETDKESSDGWTADNESEGRAGEKRRWIDTPGKCLLQFTVNNKLILLGTTSL